MGSSRLPGKSLRALRGRPLIAHVVERAWAIQGVDEVVLATTTSRKDDPLYEYAFDHLRGGIVRGDETDVLARFVEAVQGTTADIVMRVTGDCPFLDPFIASEVLRVFHTNPLEAKYVSNDTLMSGFPDGTDVEVFSVGLLRRAAKSATDPQDREHVTSWMRRETTAVLMNEHDCPHIKLSVDTEEDYDFARRIADRLKDGDYALASTLRAVEELK
jgi:spore coat polysaccharide biosynthesis protein SpsF (cytidylyltransferase family)